jgi:hypothetical protein
MRSRLNFSFVWSVGILPAHLKRSGTPDAGKMPALPELALTGPLRQFALSSFTFSL